ncbi:MipA/OmpV family protein [Rubellimicrobium rubrum]|nr:MipA/OmpV family protein [Rubellimicrobium rubrum]
MSRLALASVAALLPLQALAQEAGNRFAFSLRAGLEARPGYFGSDEVAASPDLAFSLDSLSLGPLSFGDPDSPAVQEGFGLRGSFRYLPERSADDYEELAGLNDVDGAFELGAGLSYAQPWWEAFAVVRYGVTGHESLVADLGMDLIARPSDRLSLRLGPRAFIGSDDFAQTYFGVTGAEAATSAFSAFDAEGGILSAGLEASVEYRLSDPWGIEAGLRLDRLRNDAAASPITTEDNQLSAFVGVTRRFDLRF